MHPIIQWLKSDKDYTQGVLLYARFGPYKSLLAILQKGETASNKKKLHEALREIAATITTKTVTPQPAQPSTPGKTAPKSTEVNNTASFAPYDIRSARDTTHKTLIEQANKIYAEMAVYHARLQPCDTDQKRYNMALLVLETESKWLAAIEARDHYAKTGKLLRKKRTKKISDTITQNDLRKLLNLRTALSAYTRKRLPAAEARYKQQPTAKNKVNLERTKQAIEKYKSEIEKLQVS